MPEKPAKISVIICNWNKQEDVLKCVSNVIATGYPEMDIVVVDNHSSDNSVALLKKTFSQVTIMENRENLGTAGGFNTGLKYSIAREDYDYFWLLGSDVMVDTRALAELLAAMKKTPRAAVAGSLILHMDSLCLVQEMGGYLDRDQFKLENLYANTLMKNIPAAIVEVDYVTVSSLLADARKVREVGLLDDKYFLDYDDIDWCTRFKKVGHKIIAVPQSRVWHKPSVRRRANNLPVYYYWRNHLHFYLNHLTDPREQKIFCEKFVTDAFTALYITGLLGKTSGRKTIAWAILHALSGKRGRADDEFILPLEAQPFGRLFSPVFSQLHIVGMTFDFYSQFRTFLDYVPAGIPITYYPFEGEKLPDSIRLRVKQEPFEKIRSVPEGEIMIFCRHILSEPNPREESLRDFIEKFPGEIIYLDQHSNYFKGYRDLNTERMQFRMGLAQAQEIFMPVLQEKIKFQANKK